MKLIRFIKDHGKHKINHVIGTKDSDADALIASGVAVQEQDGVKPLKYKPGAAPKIECVSPILNEEAESSPKGAKIVPDAKQKTNT